jgi:hypothetical protein
VVVGYVPIPAAAAVPGVCPPLPHCDAACLPPPRPHRPASPTADVPVDSGKMRSALVALRQVLRNPLTDTDDELPKAYLKTTASMKVGGGGRAVWCASWCPVNACVVRLPLLMTWRSCACELCSLPRAPPPPLRVPIFVAQARRQPLRSYAPASGEVVAAPDAPVSLEEHTIRGIPGTCPRPARAAGKGGREGVAPPALLVAACVPRLPSLLPPSLPLVVKGCVCRPARL